jgi:PAS domain S-box-containing protein
MLGLLALSGLIVAFSAITARSLEREAIERQQARTDAVAHRIGEKFLVIEQLARTLAALVAPLRTRASVEQLLETVLESTPDRFVYGLGVWFEPYAFSREERYFGPYVHRAVGGGAGPILTYEWATPSYDFHQHSWYRTGLLARGSVTFIEPYFDTDHVYISSVTAMVGEHGEPLGIVSVDVLRPQIQQLIADERQSDDEAIYVATRPGVLVAHPELATMLAWARSFDDARASKIDVTLDDLRAFEAARVPRLDRFATRSEVSKLGWTVTIATDRRGLFADARHLRWGTAPVLALLWTGALGLYLSWRRARRLKALALDLERSELVESMLRETLSARARVDEERSELLQRIQRRSAELQAILDNMVDSVIACDTSRTMTLMNRAAIELFGVGPEVSFKLEDLVDRFHVRRPDGGRVEVEDLPIMQALTAGTIAEGYLLGEVPGRSGEIHIQSHAAPIRDSQGQIVAAVSVLRDVTSAIELDHLKDQFLEVTAHELKTPITIMKAYAQLALREGEGLSTSLRKKLLGIDRGADRIDRILRDLLDVSQVYLGRLQLQLTEVDVREVLVQTVEQHGVDRPRHRVRVRAEDPAMIQGDRRRLEEVVVTLLDNAIRYSPEGGDVEVSLTIEGEAALVTVEDHGIGIPTKGQSRIFERFYRAHSGTDQDHGGLGVGLYVAKHLVEQLGGRMWFISTAEGSRFMFSVPLVAARGPGT